MIANDTLDNTALEINIASLIGDSQWHSYTLTAGANGLEVYIDGVSVATDATRGTDAINPATGLYLGARQDLDANRRYGGALDSVQIYDNALSATQVADLSSDNNQAKVNITVDSVSAAPVVSNLSGDTLAYTEGDGAQVIDQSTNAAVTDVDSIDFDTGTLTVSFTAGSDSAEDVLAIQNQGTGAGQIGVGGSNVTYEGVTIGTFTGGTSGIDLIITLNASADATAVSALINNITYENTDTENITTGNRSVRYVLTDGDGGISTNQDTTVTVARQSTVGVDGVIDALDLDSDNDGILDSVEDAGTYDVTQVVLEGSLAVTDPEGMAFSNDGTRLFVVVNEGGAGGIHGIQQYDLTVAYDVTAGATLAGTTLDVSAEDNSPQAISFSSDGLTLFLLGNQDDDISYYSLTTAFDITAGVSYVNAFSVATEEASPNGMSFSSDGTRLFVTGNDGDDVNQYTLTTAFDLSDTRHLQRGILGGYRREHDRRRAF